MGILNLLKEFGPATRNVHLSDYKDRTIGVDAMCWLHRSAFCCPLELVRSEFDPTTPHPTRYIYWLRKMIRMLTFFHITPIVVFDGGALPAKAGTNQARDTARAEWRAKADALFEAGRIEEASEAYGKCLNVSTTMLRNFQHLLKQEGIQYTIAPYEADAQIGYLYQQGRIYAAITEDSDLLPFGCRKILLKLDREGNCREIDLDKFEQEQWSKTHYPSLNRLRRILLTPPSSNAPSSASATSMEQSIAASSNDAIATPVPSTQTNVNFIHACVLSGCDYLPSLHGIGVKKAIQWVDDYPRVDQLLYHLKLHRKKLEDKWRKDEVAKRRESGQTSTIDPDDPAMLEELTSKMSTAEYISHFYKAALTFQHQRVFDPVTKEFKLMRPLPQQLQQRLDTIEAGGAVTVLNDGGGSNSQLQNGTQSQTFSQSQMEHTIVDSDDENDRSNEEESKSPQPPMPTHSSASSSSLLPSSHPLLQVPSFDFLGPDIPSHLVGDFLSGRIDPKTLQPYPGEFEPIDLNRLEQMQREAKKQMSAGGNGNNYYARRNGSVNAVPPVPAAPSVASFFRRAVSTPTTSHNTAKPFSLSSTSPSVKGPSILSSASAAALERSKDESVLHDFFSDAELKAMDDMEWNAVAEVDMEGEDERMEQRIESQTQDMMQDDDCFDDVHCASSSITTTANTPVPVPSNPFAMRAHKHLATSDVTTFADLPATPISGGKGFANITAAVVGSSKHAGTEKTPSAVSFLSRIFGSTSSSMSNGTNPQSVNVPASASITATAHAHIQQRDTLQRPFPTISASAVAAADHVQSSDSESICDLTVEGEEQEESRAEAESTNNNLSSTGNVPRVRFTAPASTIPQSAPPNNHLKRKTSGMPRASSSSKKKRLKLEEKQHNTNANKKSLLNFFGKNEK